MCDACGRVSGLGLGWGFRDVDMDVVMIEIGVDGVSIVQSVKLVESGRFIGVMLCVVVVPCMSVDAVWVLCVIGM